MLHVLALILTLSAATSDATPPACALEGVWRLISVGANAPPPPSPYHSIQIITKNHFVFVGAEARGIRALKSAADSLEAFRTDSGGGTYTLEGIRVTATYDFFSDPSYVGKTIVWTCRTDGDRLYQTGPWPLFEKGRKIGEGKIAEVWRRIE